MKNLEISLEKAENLERKSLKKWREIFEKRWNFFKNRYKILEILKKIEKTLQTWKSARKGSIKWKTQSKKPNSEKTRGKSPSLCQHWAVLLVFPSSIDFVWLVVVENVEIFRFRFSLLKLEIQITKEERIRALKIYFPISTEQKNIPTLFGIQNIFSSCAHEFSIDDFLCSARSQGCWVRCAIFIKLLINDL